MSTIPANIYCSYSDIADIISTNGITLRIDDLPPSTLGNVIAKAGNVIDLFLYQRYQPTDLMQSQLIVDWAANLALYYLCLRRGNPVPTGVATLYESTIGYLTDIQAGLNQIPGISPRKAYAPGLSVMLAIQRPFPRAVVERSRSTTLGGVAEHYTQNLSIYDAFGWNNQGFLNWWQF